MHAYRPPCRVSLVDRDLGPLQDRLFHKPCDSSRTKVMFSEREAPRSDGDELQIKTMCELSSPPLIVVAAGFPGGGAMD